MSEERHIDTNELLDYLCWKFAWDGDRFYPPTETAEECMELPFREDLEGEKYEYQRGVEEGTHARAWEAAVDFFEDLQVEGYDPVMRAERYVETTDDLEQNFNWEWLEDSRYDL